VAIGRMNEVTKTGRDMRMRDARKNTTCRKERLVSGPVEEFQGHIGKHGRGCEEGGNGKNREQGPCRPRGPESLPPAEAAQADEEEHGADDAGPDEKARSEKWGEHPGHEHLKPEVDESPRQRQTGKRSGSGSFTAIVADLPEGIKRFFYNPLRQGTVPHSMRSCTSQPDVSTRALRTFNDSFEKERGDIVEERGSVRTGNINHALRFRFAPDLD